ncbi:MAG: hypothetical protein ACTSXT_03480 [Candidatus Helarchaeota archaeon]
MSPIDLDELKRELPRLIKENDAIKGAIITALSGVVATREDIKEIIDIMNKRFEEVNKHFESMQKQMDKRFESMQKQMDKRFESMQKQMDKRFEEVNKRFESMQKQMDKRFEEVNKRFESMQKQMDKRFEEVNKRFESMQKQMDKRFNTLEHILINIQSNFGRPFEQFCRNIVMKILDAEGFKNVSITPITIPDPDGIVFEKTKQVEIDGFSLDPPIIIEITSILKDKDKVNNFIKKKKFVESLYKKEFRGFLIVSSTELDYNQMGDIKILCHKYDIDLINL